MSKQAQVKTQTAPTKASRTKAITVARKTEAKVGADNSAKLAKVQAAAPPAKPEPKAKGTPATVVSQTVGVAAGAMDGQPHTKAAVAAARAAEKAKFDATKDEMVAAGMVYRLDPARNVAKWYKAKPTTKAEAWPIGSVQLYPHPPTGASRAVEAKGKGSTTTKATTTKTARASTGVARTYKVLNRNHGSKPGSKRATQLEIVFAHTDTAKAKAAGAESVDFAYAESKGFITYA